MIVLRCIVPESAISVRAVRSSGPGGQNVNKVSSKVELRVDLAAITGLDAGARARLLALARNDLDADGRLLVTSQKTRDQRRNLEDAREKVRQLLVRAQAEPVPRGRRSRRAGASSGASTRRSGAPVQKPCDAARRDPSSTILAPVWRDATPPRRAFAGFAAVRRVPRPPRS